MRTKIEYISKAQQRQASRSGYVGFTSQVHPVFPVKNGKG
jgi:hypothetical protein